MTQKMQDDVEAQSLEGLARLLERVTSDEAQLKKIRLALEEEIGVRLSPTVKSEIVGNYSLKIKRNVRRALDYEVYQALNVPSDMSFVTLEPKIDLTAMRKAPMSMVGACVTEKPGKVSVKVERIEL